VDGTEVDGVVSAVESDLKLQVILLVDVSIGDFADQLSDVLVDGARLIDISLHIVLVIDVIRKLLKRGGVGLTVLLRQLDVTLLNEVVSVLAALELAQLRVVH
jgi:hypothetical protein